MTDREKLMKLLEEALDYSRMCREIKRFTGGEEENPYKTAADYLIEHGVTVQKWIPVTERLPEEREEDDEGEKHTASDFVQVAVMDSLGNKFVTDDMLCDGKWVNYPWGDFEVTHWMPLPEPPKEVE